MTGRPSSSGGYSSQNPQGQMRTHQPSRYNNMSATGYRGVSSGGPVAPYAFTQTPQLTNTSINPRQFTVESGRSASAPKVPQTQSGTFSRSQPASPSSLPQVDAGNRPLSLGLPDIPSTGSLMDPSPTLSPPAPATTAKPSPDRYRRPVRRAEPEGSQKSVSAGSASTPTSGTTVVGSIYSHPNQSSSTPSLNSQQSFHGQYPGTATVQQNSSADDLQLGRAQQSELAARYRRRSLVSIETAGVNHSSDAHDTSSPHPNVFIPTPVSAPSNPAAGNAVDRPSYHKHTTSSDSVASSRSTGSSRPSSARAHHSIMSTSNSKPNPITGPSPEPRPAARSPRTVDPSNRQPSPLSRSAQLQVEDMQEKSYKPSMSALASPQAPQPVRTSPAAEQLAALNQKSVPKSKSKLRRAFSFGSAAELRRAAAQGNHERTVGNAAPNVSKRNSKYEDELEPEQAKIAEQQEAAGLGESIYSGQGQFFTGSTDNLSISSTASSASIMLRKMGKGVKKGTRSLVGLFRPKSVVGVPAADGPVNQVSLAQVSMVTVEAEREKVNINVNPHDQNGGGTGFPKLERNSIETKFSTDSGTVSSDTRSRRSIVGGEKERAEVLAAVKKGILKRNDSNQASPKLKTYDFKVPDFNLPQIPHVNDSPKSSAPSTPADETPRSGHRRTDSITIENNDHDDYFTAMTQFASLDPKGNPMTPQGLIRNITFSPRLQFHDTWPSGEYDRRGEIATCNRLTPMLAQQIKEELNTFKMEMEVHESSKVYTHFF
ncbi:bud neck involved protein [Exophiala sp. CCFEE 6388]|uniref:Bud neck involved protein n=1 Tax=Exophiala sideris TaxID=1016849 RepID=A0ABR0JF06_9EURO|nr:bud neck involved protein [Exophiala sideris]KAK5179013.1 bud neck involved protein [Eurotiomycetes sp. CCFEE 6388]